VGDGSKNFSVTCPVAPEKQGDSYIFQPGGNSVTINEDRINWFGRDPGWQDIKGFRGAKDIEKPVGQWNKAEVKLYKGNLECWLNGILLVTTTLWDKNWQDLVAGSKFRKMPDFGTYRSGNIGLQDHGDPVWYRNIKIRKL